MRHRCAFSAPLGGPVVPEVVDEERRIVGARVGGREGLARRADEVPEASGLVVARHHVLQVIEVRANGLDEVEARGVGQEHPGPAVGEPVRERVGAEQDRERQRDGAELVHRDVGDGGLDPLGQDDPDAVPATDAESGERVGEAIAQPLQVRERERALHAPGALDVESDAIADTGVPIADVDADVCSAREHSTGSVPESHRTRVPMCR